MMLYQIADVKVIRDRMSLQSIGYGFVEFTDHDSANNALKSLNSQPVPSNCIYPHLLLFAHFGFDFRLNQQGV